MSNGGSIIAWGQTLMGGLIGMFFTVVAGIILYQYQTKSADLVYETFPPTGFTSKANQLTIYNIRVENIGDQEAEDVQVRFELSSSTVIQDLQVEPKLKSISYNVSSPTQANIKEITFSTLNPGESSSFSILSDKGKDDPLKIEVRARGIVGHSERDRGSTDWVWSFIFVLGGAVVAVGGVWSSLRISGQFQKLSASTKMVLDQELRLVRTRGKTTEQELEKILLGTPFRLFFNPSMHGNALAGIISWK